MPDAIFYDGESALRRTVSLRITESALNVHESGVWLASWPTGNVRRKHAADGLIRLTLDGGEPLARLDVSDAGDQAAILLHCPRLELRDDRERTGRIVLWSLLAAVSTTLCVVFLVPVVAERLTPLIPAAVEKRLGNAVDNQVKLLFGKQTCSAPNGKAALAKLTARLRAAGRIEADTDVAALDSRVPNAVAIPGGRIYLVDALLNRAKSVDEIAGVLAHEMGHVQHRDGLRTLIQAGGTSCLIGLLFGDVTGGGSLVLVTRYLIDTAYSRDAERAADAHASRTMLALGRSPHAMALLLRRIETGEAQAPAFLSTHPLTKERLETLARQSPHRSGEPLLSEEEWRALKEICMTS